MCRGRQDEGVGETNGPVLGPVDVHLRRGPQDSDGRDEAAGDGHGGGEDAHLFVGQEVLGGVPLTSPGKEDSDDGGDSQGDGQHDVLLPAELGLHTGQGEEPGEIHLENYSQTQAEFDCQDLPSRLFVIKTRFPTPLTRLAPPMTSSIALNSMCTLLYTLNSRG